MEEEGHYVSPLLKVKVPVRGLVSDLVDAIKAIQPTTEKVTLKTLDGSRIPHSEELHHL